MDDLVSKTNKGIEDTKAAIKALDDNIAHYEGLIAHHELALTKISNGIGWTVAGVSAICCVIGVILWTT